MTQLLQHSTRWWDKSRDSGELRDVRETDDSDNGTNGTLREIVEMDNSGDEKKFVGDNGGLRDVRNWRLVMGQVFGQRRDTRS